MPDLGIAVANGLVTGLINLVLFGLVVGARRLFNKEGLGSFLITAGENRPRLLAQGMALGALGILAYTALVLLSQQATIGFDLAGLANTAITLLAWGLGFVGVVLFEEGLLRGYLLLKLAQRLPGWAALALQGVLFGLLHFFSYATTATRWLGLVNAALIGVILGLVTLRTHSLIWALAFHWGWNLTQVTLLRSFLSPLPGLLNVQVQPGWWSGTDFVPESGLAVSLVLAGMAVWVSYRYRDKVVGK
jgi:hypothetical protein